MQRALDDISSDQIDLIRKEVRRYFWQENIDCTPTTLKILARLFSIPLTQQVLDASLGMHGAGGLGAQCGLVEGSLMFVGIIGRDAGLDNAAVAALCRQYALQFTERFSSIQCSELRPEGFSADNPPHLCEERTCQAIAFSAAFIQRNCQLTPCKRS